MCTGAKATLHSMLSSLCDSTMACKGEATSLGSLGPAAFGELATVTAQLETALRRALQPDKYNYLLLMMVDKHVHFHVIPRYGDPRHLSGASFADKHWPKPPILSDTLKMEPAQQRALTELVRQSWGEA